MNVTYTTRGFELSDQIEKYTEEKLRKIKPQDELIDVSLTLVLFRSRFKAELLVHNRSARFTAIEETSDVFKSINAVIDKIQKQLKKHREKLISRKRLDPKRGPGMADRLAATERTSSPRVVRARKQDVKPMSQDEAVMQLYNSKDGFMIYRDTRTDRITVLYKKKDGNFGLIDTEI